MEGDTQLMPSEVLQDYLSAQSKANNTSPEGKQGTYAPGDTGFVDFAGFDADRVQTDALAGPLDARQSPSSDADGDSDDDRQSEAVSEELPQPSQTVSPARNLNTVTPIAGQKHDRKGNTVHQSAGKPVADQLEVFFGASNELSRMGMTQLFRNTQAGSSSPISPANLRSDPVLARPSPHIRNLTRSTPALPASSPPTVRKPARQHQTTEPREAYLPLNESQRRRDGIDGGRSSPSIEQSDEGDSDWDVVHSDRKMELARKRKRIDRDARTQFQSFAAPNFAKSKQGRTFLSARTVIGLVTPHHQRDSTSLKHGETITISSGSKTPRNAASDDDVASDDNYDELSQALLPSSRKLGVDLLHKTPSATHEEKGPPRPNSSPVAGKYGGRLATSPQTASLAPFEEDTPKAREYTRRAQQQISAAEPPGFVENSQPEDSAMSHSVRRPLMPSSITSRGFVSQSQLATYSSLLQDQREADILESRPLDTSSIPPAPCLPNVTSPTSQGQDVDIATPASSPPIACGNASTLEKANESTERQLHLTSDIAKNDSHPGNMRPILASSEQGKENRPPSAKSQQQLDHQSEPKVLETSPITSSRGPHADVASHSTAGHSGRATSHTANHHGEVELSEKSDVFKTAPSTLTPRKHPQDGEPAMQLNLSQTPGSIHRRGIRRLADILGPGAEWLSPERTHLDDINLLNEDDQDFEKVMSDPPSSIRQTKRVKTTHNKYQLHYTSSKGAASASSIRSPTSSKVASQARHIEDRAIPHSAGNPRSVEGKLKSIHSTKAQPAQGTSVQADAKSAVSSTAGIRNSEPVATAVTALALETKAAGKNLGQHGSRARVSTTNPLNLSISPHAPQGDDRALSSDAVPDSNNQVFPNRVLAIFKGLVHAYYPATCLGTVSPGCSTLRIKFDDGSEGLVEAHLVKRFELRDGDLVKIDVPGKKNIVFIVRELIQAANEEEREPASGHGRDIFGNQKVVLEPRRRSSHTGDKSEAASGRIGIDLEKIYVTTSLFPKMKDRAFSYIVSKESARLDTPLSRMPTPTTPSTRNRKGRTTARESTAAPVISPVNQRGVFSNMAFCISYSSKKDEDKASIMQIMHENGAQMLNEGFEQLFDRATSIPGTPTKTHVNSEGCTNPLQLIGLAQRFNFAAVIADCHSRRIKYLQALALNLPCLHGRWVTDSVQNGSALPIAKYLLPAGESSFLDGGVLSRTIAGPRPTMTTSPADMSLADLVQYRPKLLADKKVMLIIGSGRLGQRRNAYTFLTRAAGPAKLEKVKDIPSARALLGHDMDWDLIFVEDSKVIEARKKLFGDAEQPVEKAAHSGDVSSRARPRVVGDETALQSFILGAWNEVDRL